MTLDYKAIGARIRERRVKRGMTQDRLASKIDLSNPHMSNIERGKTKVSLPALVAIANALDITMDELLCDNLKRGKVIFDGEIGAEIAKCDERDTRALYEIIKVVVKSFQDKKAGDKEY